MLNDLLNRLFQRESSESVFNQYQDNGILNNLRMYITYLFRHSPDLMLIGEAPGYRGCRLTGIPFTSGSIIKTSKHDIFKDIGSKIIIPNIISENTATIVWEFLDATESVPILWNAFPFHPHKKTMPSTNRKPSVSEIEEGKIYLQQVYDLFKPKKLCSLGRVGESVLKELFPKGKIIYIRHPSYGGKKDFIEGMKRVSNNTK